MLEMKLYSRPKYNIFKVDLCAGRVDKRGLRDPQLPDSCRSKDLNIFVGRGGSGSEINLAGQRGLVQVFLLSLLEGSPPPIVTMYSSTVPKRT